MRRSYPHPIITLSVSIRQSEYVMSETAHWIYYVTGVYIKICEANLILSRMCIINLLHLKPKFKF
jgi:hypothetical protein